MLLQLINASLIWLCSLLSYELVLKGETFHRLNRFFLLFTFVAGAILPLLPLGQTIYITNAGYSHNSNLSTPTSLVSVLQSAANPTGNLAGRSVNWWLMIYIAGMAGSILYLLRDLLRLWTLYRHSAIHRERYWTIAETGRTHSPFSFLHIVFTGSIDQYTPQQWRMVLEHEQQHYRSGHILDLALMHLAMIILWFHPAVYIYRHKLRMLHEYEADSLRQQDIMTYGGFLLEQAVCAPPPVLTHALSFSPLKNRIQMMTKNPSRCIAQYRLFLLLPLMCLFIWCCRKTSTKTAIDINGRHAILHNAGLSYPDQKASDSVTLSTDDGSVMPVSFVIEYPPQKLGNQYIQHPEALAATPRCTYPGSEFGVRYVVEQAGITQTLLKMPDGAYTIGLSDIIIDRSGHVVHYTLTGPENDAEATLDPSGVYIAKPNGLNEADQDAIQKGMAGVLIGGRVSFTPSKDKQGVPAPYFLESGHQKNGYDLLATLVVKNRTVSFSN